ncbi:hypothetical protein S40288_05159 [Stachybotrys chartarum IBT 40288]|nr:hypothetical protein S40288_05159 [Stachybotrys chartarum IBT 40288]
MESFTVYNIPPSSPNWDDVGVFYISYCATWTFLVLGGMTFCLLNRRHPVLRLRPLVLSFAAIGLLHSYWILAQIVYPIGGTMPVLIAYDVQYFVMGTYYPLGIALFHASNTRFLHVAKLQKQFTHHALQARRQHGCNGAGTSWLCRIRNIPTLTKIMIVIGIGMVAQTILTVSMWFACKKYHPTYGIPGTELRGETLAEQFVDLGRGWEWWPSVLWQFIWSWMFAPILLWRAWNIRDTLGWRTQTVGCCVFSLHAVPMFLISSYVPAFAPINVYFPPSQWIHLSTTFFEFFTVFLPAFQVARALLAKPKPIQRKNEWEITSQTSMRLRSVSGSSTDKPDDTSTGDRLFTMQALEHTLETNSASLQEFSALNDFSGENVAFLTQSAQWKARFLAHNNYHQGFNEALHIYAKFISPRDAPFPLNLASTDLKNLEAVFEKATRILYGETRVNAATPFDSEQGFGSEERLHADYTGEIPFEFSAVTLDNAYEHVKYLVLTNTWPRFVSYTQRRQSHDTERTRLTASSGKTLVGQLSRKISGILRLGE